MAAASADETRLDLGVYAIKGVDTFCSAQDGLLEQSVYKGVSAGTIRN
jgi:hypothetical protein